VTEVCSSRRYAIQAELSTRITNPQADRPGAWRPNRLSHPDPFRSLRASSCARMRTTVRSACSTVARFVVCPVAAMAWASKLSSISMFVRVSRCLTDVYDFSIRYTQDMPAQSGKAPRRMGSAFATPVDFPTASAIGGFPERSTHPTSLRDGVDGRFRGHDGKS
jgi:hypothetical protein